ncbi:MAG: TrkH family potassium uptake protein [Firmicutes bacterium]|nr:TrkH family potassium uptake protein [Bacillota bacterium]
MHLNYPVIMKMVGLLTLIEGFAMIPCIFTAMLYGEWTTYYPLLITSIVCIFVGLLIVTRLKFNKTKLKMQESFLIASLSWVYCSIIGMFPFYFSGCGFTFIGSFFESVAGFTTTGCTVLDTNLMPHALQLWRSVCHWLGGMGILILVISIFPLLGVGGQSIASAEAPGPTFEKIGAKISDTGKYLYAIYMFFTAAEYVLLFLGPMDWFNALTATLSSISTGGLIVTNENLEMINANYSRFVILIFTVLSSLSYLLYYMILKKKWKEAFRNMEMKGFFAIIAMATLLIAAVLKLSGSYSSLWQAVKDGLCQVISVISTSGYYVCDYTNWPSFTQAVLLLLMLVGGCSASTTGSLKVIRVLVLIKLIRRGFFRRIHPHSVKPIMLEGKPLPAATASSITMHILLYFGVLIGGTLLLSLNNLDMETTISTAVGIFSNTGMALGDVGASGYFGMWNGFSQLVLTVLMIAGRLEMYAIILLFTRSFWQPDKAKTL